MSHPRRAVFLDRDGTVCEDPILNAAPDPVLLPAVAENMKLMRERGFLLVIISNQGHIAKGVVSQSSVDVFNRRLFKMLRKRRAGPSLILYCPHHPDGSVPAISIECDCRKPAPGLILSAARDLNVDLSKSYVLGDYIWDVEAGRSAGCTTVALGSRIAAGNADLEADTFSAATAAILRHSDQ